MGWLGRIRHALGFGVHSPFAFRFIRECLRERQPYYSYAQLPEKGQRLLYRVAVFFQPSEIKALGEADASPALLACPPKEGRKPGPAVTGSGVDATRLAVADCATASPQSIAAAIADGWIVYACNCPKGGRRALEAALDTLGHGILAHNCRTHAIAIPFPNLPRLTYEARF